MRKFPTVFMRGGTSKGIMFLEQDLPERAEWDHIFAQCMGNPDPKQIDGVGGCVSSNNKIVVVKKSNLPGIDVEYLVGQSVVGQNKIDYSSNCGNMTSATAPYAVEMGLVEHLEEPITTVHMFNQNTNKYIDVDVPVKDGKFNNEGNCVIAGVDGAGGELKVNFLNPAGSKTGKLFPTGHAKDELNTKTLGTIAATILDVSNPMVLVRAEELNIYGTELPAQIDKNEDLMHVLEEIRGAACVKMGLARDLQDATENSPAVPKIGVFTMPRDYTDLSGKAVSGREMDICVRVLSMFKCHKACPLTSASAIAVACRVPGTILYDLLSDNDTAMVKIGHPGGVMTMYPYLHDVEQLDVNLIKVNGVAVQRTARRIMDGTIYIRD